MRLTPLIVTLALGACAPAAPESSPLDPGKADNPVSAGECLFGETFSGALDSEDFEISGERVIDEHSSLNSVEEAQILKGLSADEFGITDAREAVRELTQDQELRQWTMVSNVTDHDPFTAYEFHAGDNPVGFAFTMDSLELVMEHGDDDVWFCTVLRDDGGCGLDGVYRVVGDFPSFLEWTLEVEQGQLVDSFTDDLDSDEWNTTHIVSDAGDLHTFVQVTDASDAIITTTIHVRNLGCESASQPDLEVEYASTVIQDQSGSFIEEHTASISTAE